ncbi:MAG: T9SS type A sorting domain-containing protein [Flavobacterium sp.]|uniref:T9SS type A sorting domain-containing protein n=1 Tax=Flavobacterium sp. TaxID=239 RepID=UPI002621EEFA|nr:T9SS type A sorting domain-containing protein [Flavobacterium sp.]MDD5149973.1 T9SS type A sorting domain-containing protein [Flavobacterium sp.]
MTKILISISAFLAFNYAFSQNPITVSGTCSYTDALGVYNYTGIQNNKPKYVKIINDNCANFTGELTCSAASLLWYTIQWNGTNWEWIRHYEPSTCLWLIAECVPAAQSGGGGYYDTTIASNAADTSLPPCSGWTGSCTPTFSECSTLSLINNTLKQKIAYYTNPINNTFYIKIEEPYDSLKLSLVNVSGQVLMSQTYNNLPLIELNINQPNGVYLIKLTNDKNEEAVIKLIKE